MGPNEFERWIIARTELIVTARLMKQKGLTIMPLKLNKLQGKAMSFRANIEAIGREYDGANEVAVEHLADVKSLRAQMTDMQDDLTATVDITKNSVAASNAGEASEQQAEKPKEAPPTPAVEPPALVISSPEVEQQPSTFPGQ